MHQLSLTVYSEDFFIWEPAKLSWCRETFKFVNLLWTLITDTSFGLFFLTVGHSPEKMAIFESKICDLQKGDSFIQNIFVKNKNIL